MHAQVKHAWFALFVIGVASILTAAGYLVALSYVGPAKALGALGLFGLTGFIGFSPLFYRKRHGAWGVIMDERDAQIRDQCRLHAGLMVAVGFWGVVCMGSWFWVVFRYGIEATETTGVPVHWLPLLYMASAVIFEAAWSLSILVHYRLRTPDDEG